jgi:hypothetical protein
MEEVNGGEVCRVGGIFFANASQCPILAAEFTAYFDFWYSKWMPIFSNKAVNYAPMVWLARNFEALS